MAQSFPNSKSTEPNKITYETRIKGGGSSDPTKQYGPGVTVTRNASGVYYYDFATVPGNFLDAKPSLSADTAADVKGHTVTYKPFDATTKRLEVRLWNASDTADDLQTGEYLALAISFVEGSIV